MSRLLAEPGRRFHARELAGGRATAAELSATGGDAGEQLDACARQAYAARLSDIDVALAEAESFHDLARAARLGQEREFIVKELARAVGLGGRPRRAKSNDERARTAVQRRLRDAIGRIGRAAPEIGRTSSRAS